MLEQRCSEVRCHLVVIRIADSLPSLNSDGDDQEDADREGEVTTALKEGEDKVNETVIEAKVKGKNKKVRKEKEDICYAQAG